MNNKDRKPLNKDLVRSGKSWWEKIDDQWINCIPYNKREEVEEKPQGGSDLNTQQFNKIMDEFKILKDDVSELKTDVSELKTKVDKNSNVLKKHFPKDFK